ncbi:MULTISPECIES: hypothetical protein [Clostridium]|uniref:hypothetical protein n=1 Tax=Clostridium TaxID=1485 RepID=UPI0008267B67|nr:MULTISPECIES: hypothetical protein [Clostridium]PJI06567.1 hypothetical protein CUB90_01215 [Clostridium sp. CT7]
MKNNEIRVKDEKTDRFKRKIETLKMISNVVCLIGAVLVTIFIKLNFMTLAVIIAVITFGGSLGFDVVRKILNMMASKSNKNKDKSTN